MTDATNIAIQYRKDIKWVIALITGFVFGVTLLLGVATYITAEKPAVDMMTLAIAVTLSPNGLDDQQDINTALRAYAGRETFQPIPGLALSVHAKDFRELSPRDARLKFFRQLAEPLYREGSAGVTSLATTKEMAAKMREGTGAFQILTAATHHTLQRYVLVGGILSVLFLGLVIFLSRGWGRLVSPAMVFVVVSVPGVILVSMLLAGLQHAADNKPPASEAGSNALLSYVASVVLPPIVLMARGVYVTVLVVGLLLLVAALIGKLVSRVIARRRAVHS